MWDALTPLLIFVSFVFVLLYRKYFQNGTNRKGSIQKEVSVLQPSLTNVIVSISGTAVG